ncbi:unnamed protein product [Trichobilharzia regenti]|nr:unnamed protein product [Trichobilharzia regenti]
MLLIKSKFTSSSSPASYIFCRYQEREAIVETQGPAVTGGAFDTSGTPFSFHAGEGFEEGRFENDWIVNRFRQPWDEVS